MGLLFSSQAVIDEGYYRKKRSAERRLGKTLTNDEFESAYLNVTERSGLGNGGTSVFDPCVCEMDYTWYTAPGDEILDPFAGGSVRGIVAHQLGRTYTGIELRQE